MDALINNIQRFSIHDGPGIRTTVFFQGCNLRCQWCHNPDTIPAVPVFRFLEHRCMGCAACVSKCPVGALQWVGCPHWSEALCIRCGRCQAVCPAAACSLSSAPMSLEEVLETVVRDKPFYDASGGGLTCSGGEPMLSLQFVHALLQRAHAMGIHTAVDTAAHIPWEHYQHLLAVTDLFLVDYKAESAGLHLSATGVDNKRIRDNLRQFVACGVPVTVRIPVISGVNSDHEELASMGEYLQSIHFSGAVELLKMHHLGEIKYKSMGRAYRFAGIAPPQDAQMEQYCNIMKDFGLRATTG